MDKLQAIKNRHSVRRYVDKPIEGEVLDRLNAIIEECNVESGLNIQLVLNEPKAFDSRLAHYGKFSGVSNYIAMVGKKGSNLDELCGYYGEKIVIEAQTLGLNTCWVALTFKKIPDVFVVGDGEKLAVVISIGYGENDGVSRKSKSIADVSNCRADSPEWFVSGVEAALLAPTAVNQQKFKFELVGDKVSSKPGFGFYTKMDLGIAKYHFEIGSGKERDIWI